MDQWSSCPNVRLANILTMHNNRKEKKKKTLPQEEKALSSSRGSPQVFAQKAPCEMRQWIKSSYRFGGSMKKLHIQNSAGRGII